MTDVHQLLDDIRSPDKAIQGQAFDTLMTVTEPGVDWSGDVWDRLVEDLAHRNNRTRAIAAQVLCNLARSDPEKRILDVLPALMRVTHDERFVTARHCLQSLWKIGVEGQPQLDTYLSAITDRFTAAGNEPNGTLVRSDIVESLRRVYEVTADDAVAEVAEELIASETDEKYQRKYRKVWGARSRS